MERKGFFKKIYTHDVDVAILDWRQEERGGRRSRDVTGFCQYPKAQSVSGASGSHVVTFDSSLTLKKLHLVFSVFCLCI